MKSDALDYDNGIAGVDATDEVGMEL